MSQPITSLLSSFDNEESTSVSGEQGIISTHPCANGEPCPFVRFRIICPFATLFNLFYSIFYEAINCDVENLKFWDFGASNLSET